MDVEDLVSHLPIKVEDKADPPPPLLHIRSMNYFRRKELVSDVPPHLQHLLLQPYQGMGNPWDSGDPSLMNSDLTVALQRLFLMMTGSDPSEEQKVRLRRKGIPEPLLYDAVIHLIEGRVVKSRVAELIPLDEFYYLKIVLRRVSLSPTNRLFPVRPPAPWSFCSGR